MVLHKRSVTDQGQAAIAIIVALEEELAHLRAALSAGQDEQRAGRVFTHTELVGRPVVLARCGIGMISAAAVTEAVIIQYAPAAIINYGCTGAHGEDVLPGDLVLGERTVAYDRVRVAPDGTEEYKPMYYLRAGRQERIAYLPAAPELLDAARRAAARLEGRHEPWPPASGWPAGVPHRPPRLFTGVVASADRWNRAHERIRAIAGLHESLCEDMEAAAIALTCASHDIPFLTIKDISNNELLRTTDTTTFTTETTGQLGRRAAALTLATLRELGKTESKA